jgi:hypothetical protein
VKPGRSQPYGKSVFKKTQRKNVGNRGTLSSPSFLPPPANCSDMGASWQSPEQKAFIGEHTPSYIQHSTDGTLRDGFWPDFLEKWFKAWPPSDMSPDLIEKGGSAVQAERRKKVYVSMIRPSKNQLKLTICTATEAHLQSVHGRCRYRRSAESSPRKW